MSARWLVSGGTGFIGARFVRLLQARGDDVTVITRRPSVSSNEIQCDLLDADSAERLVRKHEPTHLALLAWTTEHGIFWGDEANAQWQAASERVVRSFLDAGGKTVLGVGTCAEYEWGANPLKEDESPQHPATVYGRAKAGLSRFILDACASSGACALWGRVFFVYGRGEQREKLASSLVRAGIEGRSFELLEPDRRLDFVHVDDVANALSVIASHEIGGAYNIATGNGATVRDLAAIANCTLNVKDLPPSRHNPDVVADIAKLRTLGWEPRVTLEAGMSDLRRAFEEAVI